ncbi:MAG: sigma 54-interacting transcriptional regulator, partial [Bacteroidota bacterium]
VKVDVRIIAATNRNLLQEVKAGTFREDLYYRLNVFPVQIPPLRARKEDIPLLVQHFIKKFENRIGKQITRIPQDTIRELQGYHFPGNVRELENLVERAVIVAQHGILRMGDWLPQGKVEQKKEDVFANLEEVQRFHIEQVLQHTNWRISGPKGAALILGLKPTTLEARMKKLGIRRSNATE